MHPTTATSDPIEDFGTDVDGEIEALKVAAAGLQAFQEAVRPFTPEGLRRMTRFLAEHVTHDDQTKNNTQNALLILAGLSGYTAEVHRD